MQVRFGVLNAGNFGVAQSRKRTFIWAVRRRCAALRCGAAGAANLLEGLLSPCRWLVALHMPTLPASTPPAHPRPTPPPQAAPGELLPDWPRLMHCFRTPQLTINLPGGVQYCAVPQTVRSEGGAGWLEHGSRRQAAALGPGCRTHPSLHCALLA